MLIPGGAVLLASAGVVAPDRLLPEFLTLSLARVLYALVVSLLYDAVQLGLYALAALYAAVQRLTLLQRLEVFFAL
jgi:hypothetical protein